MKAFTAAVAASLLCAAPNHGAEPPQAEVEPATVSWTSVANGHFQLYTTAGEQAGLALFNRLERLRTALAPLLPGDTPARGPVTVIAFQSHQEFEPYAPSERACGFFLPSRRRDFIVLETASPHTRTAAHEYGHFLLAHSGLRLPTWLNEGLAEVYSNVAAEGPDGRLEVGRVIDSRLASLHRERWIPLADLVEANARSPIFTSPDLVDASYAESWLLAHMLLLDPAYSGGFPRLLQALQAGGTADGLRAVYDKSVAEVEADLTAYLAELPAHTREWEPARGDQAEGPVLQPAADFEARLTLAEMLHHYLGRGQQARELYRQLVADYPQRPEAEDGLAETYRFEGNQDLAAEHHSRAALLYANLPAPH